MWFMKVKELIDLLHKLDATGEKEVELYVDLDWTADIKSLKSEMLEVSDLDKTVTINC